VSKRESFKITIENVNGESQISEIVRYSLFQTVGPENAKEREPYVNVIAKIKKLSFFSHSIFLYISTIDVKNINLQIKNIKNMFFSLL